MIVVVFNVKLQCVNFVESDISNESTGEYLKRFLLMLLKLQLLSQSIYASQMYNTAVFLCFF